MISSIHDVHVRKTKLSLGYESMVMVALSNSTRPAEAIQPGCKHLWRGSQRVEPLPVIPAALFISNFALFVIFNYI